MSGSTEQEETESAERFRVIFDSVNDGIFVCDAETGAFMDVNAAGGAMFGFSRDELIGRTFEALSTGLPPYVQRDVMTLLEEAQSLGPQIFEWHCKAKNDHLFWGEISLRCASLGGRPVGLAILRDITERKRMEDEIAQLAHFDVLTGLPNRRNFDVVLEQEIARSARYGAPLSLAMGDLDLFKNINDTFGHQAGDAVLKSLAALLRKSLRRSDYIARWGGEEFTVLLPETKLDVSEMLLNRLRTSIANQVIPEIGRAVTLSFGVTAYAKPDSAGRSGETGRPGALPVETDRSKQGDQNHLSRPFAPLAGDAGELHAADTRSAAGRGAMKTSQDRILTTHTGSLPRPSELRAVLVKKDQGEPYDKAELARLTREAVSAIVRRQAEVGVDVINDGEMSKPGYSTYVADRLTGFAGHEPAKPRLDTGPYPNFMAAYTRMTGDNVARRAVCVGPIAVKDEEPLKEDLANLKAALAQVNAVEGFMTAASPGLVPVFQNNRYYPTYEAYVEAIAAAMQPEYEAIVAAGFVLQLDCPDLAMAHHTSFQDLSEADFLKRAGVSCRGLEPRAAQRAGRHGAASTSAGAITRGRTTTTSISPRSRRSSSRPSRWRWSSRRPTRATRMNGRCGADLKLPDDKILAVGVLDTSTNYVEHPELVAERLCRFADIVGKERVMATSDCGFGTFAGYGKIDPDIAFKKLRRDGRGRGNRLEALVGPRLKGPVG